MERAILTPRNETVHELNSFALERIPGAFINYISADRIDKAGGPQKDADNLYPTEFLNSLSFSGMSDHKL
jgi:ATP-dependent DNA helicase PIF1